MVDFKKGQRVTHPTVNCEMVVDGSASIGGVRTSNGNFRSAPKMGYTSCTYRANGRTIKSDFPTSELVLVQKAKLRTPEEEMNQFLQNAIKILTDGGMEQDTAIEKVINNFKSLNNSNMPITLVALCSENPFDPDWI
ncbi:hypothetical protein [Shewanella xiamenensis]|uniref:hypothetical protein n=1 Tax=Shewanella xiamenensis TaxID=332186 RepID=UPI002E7BAC9C|nr:hypothetical protein [Shewanella xiamenensis]MEE1982757.1 hypothetical protein [Shewanella xiamenensis]